MDTPINRSDREKMVVGVWSDYYTVNNLPIFIYNKTQTLLQQAILEGYKKDVKRTVRYTKADLLAIKKLRENIYLFSAAKTYAETHSMQATKLALRKVSKLMTSKGDEILPYKAFRDGYYKMPDGTLIYAKDASASDIEEGTHVKGAVDIFGMFNDTYLKSEYNTVFNSANADARWQRISEDKDTFPYLEYSAVEDEVICDICADLDGITAPVDDPFWDDNYPPQHYNTCRCTVIQHNEEEGGKLYDSDKASAASALADDDGRQPLFKNNVGKTHVVFQVEGAGQHPYFALAPNLISKNFNLPKYGSK